MTVFGAAIVEGVPRWTDELIDLASGAHVVVLVDGDPSCAGIEGRAAGLHLRDTIAVLWPAHVGYALLFRTPTDALLPTLVEAGTGALNAGACRVRGDGRWPANLALVHGPKCTFVGMTRVEGHKGYPNGPGGSSVQFSQKGTKTTRTGAWAGHADEDGKEAVPVWECQRGCPAGLLDARFYPQFESPDAFLLWVRTLVTPPGASVLERGV